MADKDINKDFLKGLFEANKEADKGAINLAKELTPGVVELVWALYSEFRKKGASKDEALVLTKLVLSTSVGGNK